MPGKLNREPSARWHSNWLWLIILVSACTSAPHSQYPAPSPLPEPSTEPHLIPPDAQVLRINPEQTRIHIKVYRDGKLAHMGHNHVITAHGVSGKLWMHPDLEQSGFSLSIPVAQLMVDDPEARAVSGEAFARPVSSQTAAATRRNLLGEKVLDALRFPDIDISTVVVRGEAPNLEATIKVTLKGVSNILVSEALVSLTDQQLAAEGNLSISQQSFNITPFSTLGGALRVRDGIDIEYQIVADRPAD